LGAISGADFHFAVWQPCLVTYTWISFRGTGGALLLPPARIFFRL